MQRQTALGALLLRAAARPVPAHVPQWRHRSSSTTPPSQQAATAAKEAGAEAETAAAKELRATAEAKLKLEMSGMLFPWERSAFGDRTEGLKWWQKAYWVGFACVMTYWVGEKSYNKVTTGKWHGNAPPPPAAAKRKPKPTLVKSRVNDALRGASFVDDEDDPFEGLTPEEIEALVAKEAPAGDAFEGMTPEEINEYLAREQAERRGEEEQQAAAAAAPAAATTTG